MSESNIVENWLKSLDLEQYTEQFIDNGYDDLEICKQVGEPDLDAIGVESSDDRQRLLEAVKTLKEKGGTAVYLTLEDEERTISRQGPVRPTLDNLVSDVPPPSPSPARLDADPALSQHQGSFDLITYPKFQLTLVVRDKLQDDRIDLASPPYTAQNLAPCWSSLTALAIKYASELRTCVEDVLDRLEDLRWWQITEDTVSIYSPPSMTSSTMEDPYYPSLYSCSPRGGPPPIPTVPPPEASHVDGYGHLQSIHTRYTDSPSHANYVTLDTGMCCVFPRKIVKGESEAVTEKKKTSTLGRLFRNMGFRRSSRKHSYKKHQGDLLAHEITMGDNDRIALMQMVKEGKISTETALQVVKKFEEERKKDDPSHTNEHGKDKDKKSASKSKKSASMKPTKSPSMYSESQCEVCNNLSVTTGNYPVTFSGGHQCLDFQEAGCRHRRVHSVSHIAYPEHLRSPGTARAMSCSPMRSHSTQNSAVNSPVGYSSVNQAAKIYTPVIPHELKMYSGSRGMYGVHGIDMIKDRLNVIKTSTCVHKTQSKASLISSESDHSMECLSHLGNQGEPQAEEMYFPSNNSTVSVGSDTLPAMNGRRKCGSAMEKIRNHKWQRTGSVSQGEDGMSTDTDDLDDPDRLLLGGGTSSSSHMMEKFRGVRNEMRRRILHTRDIIGDGKSQHLCSAYQTAPGINQSVSSTDSCSSGIGSQSGQIWTDLDVQGQGQMAGPPVLGIARVTSNYTPSQGEKDFLHLRRGERVHVIDASSGGIWKGQIDNRVGYFHFNFVDMISESTPTNHRKDKARRRMNRRSKPQTVEELLQRIGLDHLAPIFLMNGYDNLEIFAEIDHEDLNALNILDSESRTKLITAAELLTDNDGPPEPPMRNSRSAAATPTSQQYAVPWTSFFPSKPSSGSRDSGCYDSNEFMNRENDPYASANRMRAVSDKENLRPNGGKKVVNPQQTVPGSHVELSLNGAKVQNGTKEEKIYSEEDQEVCHITGTQSSKKNRSSPRQPSLVNGRDSASSDVHSNYRSLNIPMLGPDWKVFSDSYSQTSPYGSLSDSFHASGDAEVVAPGSAMSSSIHGDLFSQNISTLTRKTKPYARKISPSVPMKDAQVQVMCPLGLFPLQSPCSPTLVSKSVTQSSSETKSQSAVSQTGSQQQTFSQVISSQYGSQSTVETAYLARVSYTSQNSRDGDSGSDASTVKSDKLSSGPDQGRSTPDSLYGPIHKSFKSIKRSVIPKVTSKLASENIDLAAEPYSNASGACSMPPLLVQRYAEELKQDVFKTAVILDQVRMHKLSTMGRPVIPAEQLTEQSLATSELKIATIPEFFISIGLPMYADTFCMKGFTSVEAISNLPVKEIQSISKAERKHLKRIIHALEWVQNRLKSPSRKVKSSPVKDKV